MTELRPPPYKPRAPRVPPEAPAEESGRMQDRRFLARMILFVAIVLWLGLQFAARVAVSHGDAYSSMRAAGNAIFWVCIMTFILTWFTKGSRSRKFLSENLVTLLAVWAGAILIVNVIFSGFLIFRAVSHP